MVSISKKQLTPIKIFTSWIKLLYGMCQLKVN